jgi:hypothetical protein
VIFGWKIYSESGKEGLLLIRLVLLIATGIIAKLKIKLKKYKVNFTIPILILCLYEIC